MGNELAIIKDKELLAKTKTMKSRIQLLIFQLPEELISFNSHYEEFKDKKLIIELNNNYKIWEIIQKRLS